MKSTMLYCCEDTPYLWHLSLEKRIDDLDKTALSDISSFLLF